MADGRVVGAVFARGGSKGIPGKNLKPLGNRPLLLRSLDALARVDGLWRIVVSTDDAAIADAARAWGAEIVRRPAELATDTAPEWLAWQHFVAEMGAEWGRHPGDILLSAPTTSPLRSPADLAAALDRLRTDMDADGVISVTPAARNPYFNMVTIDDHGHAALVIQPQPPLARRQDAPAIYDVTTVVFAMRAGFIRSAPRMYAGRMAAIVVPPERAVDIDSELDFVVAEALLARSGAIHTS